MPLKCSGFAFCYLFYGLVFQSSPINPSTLCLLTKRLLLLKYCPPAKYKTTQKMHLNRWSLACSPRFRVVNHITTKNIHTKKVIFLQVKNIWWQFFSVLACMHNAEFPFPKFENWAPLLVTVLLHDNSDDDDHHQRRVVCSRWKFHLTLASIFPKLIRILLVMASQCWLDKCNFGGENPGSQKVIGEFHLLLSLNRWHVFVSPILTLFSWQMESPRPILGRNEGPPTFISCKQKHAKNRH